jgi:hypothetical protein
VAGLVLLSSLLAVVYVWRLVEIVYFQQPSEETAKKLDPAGGDFEQPRHLIPARTLTLAGLYFGIFTDFSVSSSEQAAARIISPPSEQVAARVLSGHFALRDHANEAAAEFDPEDELRSEAKSRRAAQEASRVDDVERRR